MAAYYIVTHTITDLERYVKEYIPNVGRFLAKYGGEVLVAEPHATPIQGDPASGGVVIKFPSEEHIQQFVNDPEYKPIKAIRLAVMTNAHAVMAPEFVRPQR